MKVKFKDWDCIASIGEYPNRRTAITLADAETGEPVATATVNLPDVGLIDGLVVVKDYSENEGMLDALVKAGVVSKPIAFTSAGFAKVPICRLLMERGDE